MAELVFYHKDFWNEKLKKFLFSNFPYRDKRYLEWSIKQTEIKQDSSLQRTFMIVDESLDIIACTTALWTKIKISSKNLNMYWAVNTIVNSDYRGKGIGRIIYKQRNKFRDRCSIGYTDAAHAIEKRLIDNYKEISSVFVYVSFNLFFFKSLSDRLFKIKQNDWKLPEELVFNNVNIERVDDIESLDFPKNGFWQNDEVELIRDKDFFKNRFIDIYRKYTIYQAKVEELTVGYFVIRPATYKGFNMLSLVDFRFKNEQVYKSIMKAMNIIARKNKVGMCITLTSLKKKRLSYGCTMRMPKVLYGGTTMAELKEDDFMLITSADSDLDFVYYK